MPNEFRSQGENLQYDRAEPKIIRNDARVGQYSNSAARGDARERSVRECSPAALFRRNDYGGARGGSSAEKRSMGEMKTFTDRRNDGTFSSGRDSRPSDRNDPSPPRRVSVDRAEVHCDKGENETSGAEGSTVGADEDDTVTRKNEATFVRHYAMKPDKFDAKKVALNTFIIQFETCCKYNKWSEQEKAAQLKCCLSGDAAQLLWDCPDVDKMTYLQLIEKLKARYGSAGQREKFAAELRARRRRKNESVAELYHDVRRLLTLAYPEHGGSEL